MIHRAYRAAVEQLRCDPHFALPVPTIYEVAAHYRRLLPETPLEEIRTQVIAADLAVIDVDAPGPRAA